mmetsp:Transcript_30991/g.70884  ORF Transcript_30991/g.70884 Transcript_30991/m.70884 type:complete len:91 (-) Transcript_30991:42-314(-)
MHLVTEEGAENKEVMMGTFIGRFKFWFIIKTIALVILSQFMMVASFKLCLGFRLLRVQHSSKYTYLTCYIDRGAFLIHNFVMHKFSWYTN